jgi:cytochrome c oxidase assembly factor 5
LKTLSKQWKLFQNLKDFVKPDHTKLDSSQSACKDAAQQLVLCMEKAPCVVQRRHPTISACLKAGDTEGCDSLRRGYFECRRGQLDMRTRIQGRKHQDVGGNNS